MTSEKVLEEKLVELERRVTALESAGNLHNPNPGGLAKPLSIQEFLSAKRPTTDIEKTLWIAYFVEKHEGVVPFNVNDLREGFARGREQLPSNINDAVNKNILKGFIMEVPERKGGFKSWVLTNTGEARVARAKPEGD